MTVLNRYWLASAALLVATAGGQAADLPFRKAAPVEYVRICDAFGAGFFYIPGTDTCIRVAGQLRGEYSFRGNAPTNNPASFAYNQAGQVYRRDLTNFRARAYLNADARTQTAYGTLRAFISLRTTQDTTAPGPSGGRGETGVVGVPAGTRVSTGIFQGLPPTTNQNTVDKAFIQFAGLTAGRTQSFFDFDAQSYELLTNTVANSNQVTELLAYTATFGGGFSATVSIENSSERSIGDNGQFVFSEPFRPLPVGGLGVNFGSQNNPNVTTGQAGILAYGGEQIPDIVANIRYDAEWGSAQIAGAYHQLTSVPVARLSGSTVKTLAVVPGSTITPSADGFAVIGGVKVLLPMIAKGDSVTVQGTYEEGAMDYVNPINYLPVGLSNVYHDSISGIPGAVPAAILGNSYTVPVNDAFVLPNGQIGKNHAVGAYGAFRHYFVPEVYGTLYGSYLDITNPIEAERLGAGTDSARIWQIGGNVIWVPIKDFQIGAEALYTNLLYKSDPNGLYFGSAATRGAQGTSSGTTPRNPDDYRARLSLRRAF